MADSYYKITLSAGTANGYFTVAKDATASGETEAKFEATADYKSSTMKNVAQITIGSNDVYTLRENGTTAVYLDGKLDAAHTWNISTGAGDDTIDATSFEHGTVINAGNGNNSIEAADASYLSITTGTGKDTITAGYGDTINSGAGDDSVVIASDKDFVTVTAGEGKDTIDVGGKNATVNAGNGNDVVSLASTDAVIDLGAGNDSILANSSATGTITLGAGKDTVSLEGNASVTLTDYAFGTDVISADNTNITSTAILMNDTAATTFTTGGQVSLKAAKVTVNKTNGFYAAEITNGDSVQGYAWATEDGGTVNASSYKKSAIILGNNNGDTADLLIGGGAADTLVAGSYDSVYGGKGNDTIYVNGDYVTVGLYNDGSSDSVSSFRTGFDDEDTTIYYNGDLASAKIAIDTTANTLTVTNGKSKLTGSMVDGSTTYTDAKIKVTNGTQSYNVKVLSDKSTTQATDGTTSGAVWLDGDTTAVFANKDSVLNIGQSRGDTTIDLGNTGNYGDTRYYSGLQIVDAATSHNDIKLVGSAKAANTLIGGTGATSLYGGGSSRDSLVGGTGSDTFYYGDGDGRDTITGYHYDAADVTDSDKLAFLTSDVTKVTRTSDDTVKVVFGSGTNNTLTVNMDTSDTPDTAIAYSVGGKDHLAKIGRSDATANTFTYDSTVDYYQGGTASDTVSVSGDEDAEIWLDGSKGVTYTSIENVNASTSTGNVTLAGGAKSEVLTAGSGDASLWGGTAGNDTLVGGAASNTYFFGKGNGSDVIDNTTGSSDASDRVMLYDVALSDVKSYAATSTYAMVVELNDGSKLSFTTSGLKDGTTFQLTDGSWKYSTTDGTWTQA